MYHFGKGTNFAYFANAFLLCVVDLAPSKC